MVTKLTLNLFGVFQIEIKGEAASGINTNKARAILVYLALEADHSHPRSILAEFFWPNKPEGTARNSLKQALSTLRKSLGDRESASPYLLIDWEEVQFNSGSDYWVDVNEFTSLINDSKAHPHRSIESCSPCVNRLRQAVELYQGDFLAQFSLPDSAVFEEWVVINREAFQRQMSDALRTLTAHEKHYGDYIEACQYANRMVELDPWNEENHRELIDLLAKSGQRSAALKQFQTCQRILADELGVEPSPETQELYERIKVGDFILSSKATTSSTSVNESAIHDDDKDDISSDYSVKKVLIYNFFPIGMIVIALVVAGFWFSEHRSDLFGRTNALATVDELPNVTGMARASPTASSSAYVPATLTPASIITTTLTSGICAPGEKFIYFDDFNDGIAQGWPEIEFRAGGFRMGEDPDDPENTVIKMVGPEEYYFLSQRKDFPENLTWRFHFRIDGAARLILHLNDYEVENYGGFYLIEIATPGTHTTSDLSRQLDSAPGQDQLILLKNFNTVSPNIWHFLEISHFENTIEIWVDGVQYMKYQDPNPPPPSGDVSQGVHQLSKNSIIYVDQMMVCELFAPFEPLN